MAEGQKPVRLAKAAKEFNIGMHTVVEFLKKKGFDIDEKPTTKLTPEMYALLEGQFQQHAQLKKEAKKIGMEISDHETVEIGDTIIPEDTFEEDEEIIIRDSGLSTLSKEPEVKEVPKPVEEKSAVAPEPEKPEEPEPEVKATPEPEPVEVKETEPEEKPAEPVEEVKEKVAEPVAEKVEEEPKIVEKTEEPEEDTTKVKGPKVVGSVDLEAVDKPTRPKKKTAAEKKKEAEERKKKKEAAKAEKKAKEPKAEEPEKADTGVEEKEPEKAAPVKEGVEEPIAKEEKAAGAVEDENHIRTEVPKLEGPKIQGKIELPVERKKKPVASSKDDATGKGAKKKRKRIRRSEQIAKEEKGRQKGKAKDKRPVRERAEISEEEVRKELQETLSKLQGHKKDKGAVHRREKRKVQEELRRREIERQAEESKVLKVTEFVTANELANMMNVEVNKVIAACMTLGLFVSINQRLDAETIVLVAEEFGYSVEFVTVDDADLITEPVEEEDNPEDLVPRAPIVTVMGHVDHGKTKLLDYIRKSNVVAGEAGGITQHIGAYEVQLENGKKITFLDTPGHEAFTAMRARGAKVTDVAVIVIAADDNVMPQTKEAINHAQAAGVPIVFAINKIDKPTANPDKIREELSQMNILVEEWGGKYQCQEISAKQGLHVDELLEKVLLEAELLDLKANPNKAAKGTVIESSLDKGRGYVAKILVQDGTLKTGDIVVAGSTFGRVKAMYNERNQRVDSAGPSTPVLMLGLNGAPQAGDVFNVFKDEREAKALATKRQQLMREQGLRAQKHITLDEIGRRIAIGDFKELNVIVKGDVDGSVEALSDSLLKLSNEQVQVNIIHKSVGQVTETDVMLASASDAIIVAFQVRPSPGARKLAEQEQIDIRTYSIIYQAIEEVKAAIEGMLSPDIEEKITCNVEVREVFKISKVGTVAGCYVLDGTITRNTKVRVIRDGIVVYTGMLGSLKRFKDDVKEVKAGYECGLNIENFNDIKVGDIIEGYEEVEVRRTL
ncbi:MAG: hypothetical protein Kow00127_17150 [Bacteroidales bacterium]